MEVFTLCSLDNNSNPITSATSKGRQTSFLMISTLSLPELLARLKTFYWLSCGAVGPDQIVSEILFSVKQTG